VRFRVAEEEDFSLDPIVIDCAEDRMRTGAWEPQLQWSASVIKPPSRRGIVSDDHTVHTNGSPICSLDSDYDRIGW